MIRFTMLDQTQTVEALGFLPALLDDTDPRPARDQLNDRYQHGGGWAPLQGFVMGPTTYCLSYPGDPPYRPVAVAHLPLSKEVVVFYQYQWLAVMQLDRSIEVSRVD
jgi:hypothetical protein